MSALANVRRGIVRPSFRAASTRRFAAASAIVAATSLVRADTGVVAAQEVTACECSPSSIQRHLGCENMLWDDEIDAPDWFAWETPAFFYTVTTGHCSPSSRVISCLSDNRDPRVRANLRFLRRLRRLESSPDDYLRLVERTMRRGRRSVGAEPPDRRGRRIPWDEVDCGGVRTDGDVAPDDRAAE